MALYSEKRNRLLELALKMTGRVGDNQVPTVNQYKDAADIFNSIMSKLNDSIGPLIQLELKSQTVTSQSFTLATEDEHILLLYRSDSSGDEYPMKLLSYNEYYGGISDKTDTGTPNCYYVDYQSTRTVYLYPVPTSDTIYYLVSKKFQEIDSNDVIPLDNRYYLYLLYETAYNLGLFYRIEGSKIDRLKRERDALERTVSGREKRRYNSIKKGAY